MTNVPLTLVSRISVPNGVRVSVAWYREASTSGTTMSLSDARPIVTEPAGLTDGVARGAMRLTKRVAKFAPSTTRVSSLVTSVGGTSWRTGAERALTCVTWSGGGPVGGRPAWTVVGYSDGDSGGAGRTGEAGRPCATGAGGAGTRRGSAGGGRRQASPRNGPASTRTSSAGGRRGPAGRRRPAPTASRADLERQLRPACVADVDALPVMDVDHRPAVAVDECAVHRTVVDGDPLALFEAQDQMRARNPRVGDPDIGTQVAPDDDVVTRHECAF